VPASLVFKLAVTERHIRSGYKEIEESHPIKPIPSVLDLTELQSANDASGSDRHLKVTGTASRRPKKLASEHNSDQHEKAFGNVKKPKIKVKRLQLVHYDVDVLTKVIVYIGIALLAK
jgi:hypothetical protein